MVMCKYETMVVVVEAIAHRHTSISKPYTENKEIKVKINFDQKSFTEAIMIYLDSLEGVTIIKDGKQGVFSKETFMENLNHGNDKTTN